MEGSYKVHLKVVNKDQDVSGTGREETVQLFSGCGNSPYEAIRSSCKKARDHLLNFNGQSAQSSATSNGLGNGKEVTETDCDGEDTDAEEASAQPAQDWVQSLENFFSKGLAEKVARSVRIIYSVVDQSDSSTSVQCSLGQLRVQAESETEAGARQHSAHMMMDKIDALASQGEDVLKMISPPAAPTIRDETVVSDDGRDDERIKQQEAETLASSDDEVVDAAPVEPKSITNDSVASTGEMLPGVEYCMALMRTDRPTGESGYQC